MPFFRSLSPVEQAALHHEGNFPPPAPLHRFVDLTKFVESAFKIPSLHQERQRERVPRSTVSRQLRSAREVASSSSTDTDSPPTTSTSTTRSSATRSGSTTTLRRYHAPRPSRRTGFFRILRLPRLQQLFVVFLLGRARKGARGIYKIFLCILTRKKS